MSLIADVVCCFL